MRINDDLELLMEVAEWWIKLHAIDHFEKALKIREMVKSGKYGGGGVIANSIYWNRCTYITLIAVTEFFIETVLMRAGV